jgi:3'-5' exonuclease
MKTNNILFIDIETVSQFKSFDEAPKDIQNIWAKKYEKNEYLNTLNLSDSYESKAAIFAEYGKIICISIGYYNKANDEYRVKSFANDDEIKLLEDFKGFCLQLTKNYVFCGHNIKEFDIPYLCRRFLINRISIPPLLDFQDKKPWEVELIDTLQLWKFGDYKNYTSLETLTTIFNIPTPKADIDGSQVGQVYWNENDLQRIVEYCQNDVVAVIQLYRAFNQQDLVLSEKIQIIC